MHSKTITRKLATLCRTTDVVIGLAFGEKITNFTNTFTDVKKFRQNTLSICIKMPSLCEALAKYISTRVHFPALAVFLVITL